MHAREPSLTMLRLLSSPVPSLFPKQRHLKLTKFYNRASTPLIAWNYVVHVVETTSLEMTLELSQIPWKLFSEYTSDSCPKPREGLISIPQDEGCCNVMKNVIESVCKAELSFT